MSALPDLIKRLETIYAGNSESRLHKRVVAALQHWKEWGAADGRAWEHEFTLDRQNRIDFLVTAPGLRVGIECKTVWKGREVERQVYRYADHLPEIILLTAKPLPISSGIITNSKGLPVNLTVLELWKNQP